MRVLHIAGREASGSRKRVVLDALRQHDLFGRTARTQASRADVRQIKDMKQPHAMSLVPVQILRRRTASRGHAVFRQQCAPRASGLRSSDILNDVIGKRAPPR